MRTPANPAAVSRILAVKHERHTPGSAGFKVRRDSEGTTEVLAVGGAYAFLRGEERDRLLAEYAETLEGKGYSAIRETREESGVQRLVVVKNGPEADAAAEEAQERPQAPARPRFANTDALRAHLRTHAAELAATLPEDPKERQRQEHRVVLFAQASELPTLLCPPRRRLAVISWQRGTWYVAAPARLGHIGLSLPNRVLALRLAAALEEAFPEAPWDGDNMAEWARAFRADNGDDFHTATERVRATVPGVDPHGMLARELEQRDLSRAAVKARRAREAAAGYTEAIDVNDVAVGDEIAFTYILTRTRWAFEGLTVGTGHGSARTVVVRGRVIGEGRLMTRHGNNYDEGIDGLRFPLADATWHAEDGTSGPVRSQVTTWWLAEVLRRPAPVAAQSG